MTESVSVVKDKLLSNNERSIDSLQLLYNARCLFTIFGKAELVI